MEQKVVSVNERGLTSADWSVYNNGTKRTRYSSVPTSDITAEMVTADGFVLAQKDSSGIETSATRSYTASGMQLTRTDGRGNTTITVADIAGRVLTVTDAAGNATGTTYCSCCEQPATGIWSVEYNAENRPTRFTSEDGAKVIECTYDSMGRRASKKVTTDGSIAQHRRFIYRGRQGVISCRPQNIIR